MSTSRLTASRVVAITGAGRGIGLAAARALHAVGTKVALGDIDAAAAQEAADDLGDGAIAAFLDVTDPASFADFIAVAERELGPIDVLDNNAGIRLSGPQCR